MASKKGTLVTWKQQIHPACVTKIKSELRKTWLDKIGEEILGRISLNI